MYSTVSLVCIYLLFAWLVRWRHRIDETVDVVAYSNVRLSDGTVIDYVSKIRRKQKACYDIDTVFCAIRRPQHRRVFRSGRLCADLWRARACVCDWPALPTRAKTSRYSDGTTTYSTAQDSKQYLIYCSNGDSDVMDAERIGCVSSR